MHSVAVHLQLALPHLSDLGRTALATLVECGGRVASADALAVVLGLTNRFKLSRVLRREGLPQLEELSAWIRVLSLLAEGERTGRPLYRLALAAAEHPPTCYRLIKRITGRTWSQTRADGYGFLLVRFLRRCDRAGGNAARVGLDLQIAVMARGLLAGQHPPL